MEFKNKLNERIELIDKALENYLKPKYPERLYEAMGYSVFAGGKRLRPVLLLSACEAVGGNIEDAVPFACALEMIHTYSLIHDDLPAMDNDDFRRGKPTCHKQFDEALAILAGDGLLTYAFEVMLEAVCAKKDIGLAKAAKLIANYSGSEGMLVGQVVDVESEGTKIDDKTLMYIHDNKTGGLIKAALMAGAMIGGAHGDVVRNFEKIGYNMGIAFQIKDDILDVTSTTEVLGKPVLSDVKNDKQTYVSLYGLDNAQQDYETLSNGAVKLINDMGDKAEFLAWYAESLINREK
ncbi:MAG: polyprenyl synthetase family protein [Clostridia bacterium]|nr:polyprenyl synthetase family protein [Clostridia bacterium]